MVVVLKVLNDSSVGKNFPQKQPFPPSRVGNDDIRPKTFVITQLEQSACYRLSSPNMPFKVQKVMMRFFMTVTMWLIAQHLNTWVPSSSISKVLHITEPNDFILMLPPYSRPRPSRNKAPGPSPVPGALVRPAAS